MKRSLAVLLAVLLATAAVAPAAAQSDDGGILGGLVDDEDGEDPWWATIGNFYLNAENTYQKWQDRIASSLPFWGGEAAVNATMYAGDVEQVLENSNASIRAFVNERVAPRDIDVVRVYFHDRDGGNVTRYIVANATADGWTSGPAVLTQSQFNQTNRTVDHWLSLDWFASKHAADELQQFVNDNVETGENVSRLRKANLLRKYAGSIKSSAWGDESPAFGGGS